MTNNKEQQIQEIEIGMEQAKKIVALGDAYNRLQSNPDYKLVVGEEYFRNEAARLTMLTAEPNLDDQRKSNVQAAIRGIGEFGQFLRVLSMQGDLAREAISSAEQALYEVENDLEPDQEA